MGTANEVIATSSFSGQTLVNKKAGKDAGYWGASPVSAQIESSPALR